MSEEYQLNTCDAGHGCPVCSNMQIKTLITHGAKGTESHTPVCGYCGFNPAISNAPISGISGRYPDWVASLVKYKGLLTNSGEVIRDKLKHLSHTTLLRARALRHMEAVRHNDIPAALKGYDETIARLYASIAQLLISKDDPAPIAAKALAKAKMPVEEKPVVAEKPKAKPAPKKEVVKKPAATAKAKPAAKKAPAKKAPVKKAATKKKK